MICLFELCVLRVYIPLPVYLLCFHLQAFQFPGLSSANSVRADDDALGDAPGDGDAGGEVSAPSSADGAEGSSTSSSSSSSSSSSDSSD